MTLPERAEPPRKWQVSGNGIKIYKAHVKERRKSLALWSALAAIHAALTFLAFALYVDYAIRVDHGQVAPTSLGTFAQYVKSVFFLPILLPLLRWRPELLGGPVGFVVVVLNSSTWAWARCGFGTASFIVLTRTIRAPIRTQMADRGHRGTELSLWGATP